MALGQEIKGKPLRICDGCGHSEKSFRVTYLIALNNVNNNAFICGDCAVVCVQMCAEAIEKKKSGETQKGAGDE